MLFLTLNLLFSPEIHWISSITISSVGYMFYFFCHLSPSQLKNILKPALSLINLRKNSHHGYLLWVPPLSSYQSSWKSSLYFLSLTHHFHSLCKPLQSGSCPRWQKSSLVTTAGKSNSEELSSLTDLCCPWLCPSPWSSFLPWFRGAFLVLTPLPPAVFFTTSELSPLFWIRPNAWGRVWTICSIHHFVYPCSQTYAIFIAVSL